MPAPPPERIGFALVGGRDYVRATDVLGALLTLWPEDAMVLKFARPLTGPAILTVPAAAGSAITARVGTLSFGLTSDPAAPPDRQKAPKTPTLHLSRNTLNIFAFTPRTPLAQRIARCFDLVHPAQPQLFAVRQITLHAGPARHAPLLWFRLVTSPTNTRASLKMRTPFGPLADISFHLTPKL